MRPAFVPICKPRSETPMDIYLPIAEMSVNLFLLLGLGGLIGFLSGIFGVGGEGWGKPGDDDGLQHRASNESIGPMRLDQ